MPAPVLPLTHRTPPSSPIKIRHDSAPSPITPRRGVSISLAHQKNIHLPTATSPLHYHSSSSSHHHHHHHHHHHKSILCSRILPRSKTRLTCILIFLTTITLIILVFTLERFTDIDEAVDALDPLEEWYLTRIETLRPIDPTTSLPINIDRSFDEPDYALLSSPQPHTVGCDFPLDIPPNAPRLNQQKGHHLLLLGIFSTPSRTSRRTLIRSTYYADAPSHLINIKFVFGLPKTRSERLILAREQDEFGDVVVVDCQDNIDEGKTWSWFRWVATKLDEVERPRFVAKADDDTFFVMPNLVSAFKNLDCSKNIYWGTSAGMSHHFQFYFRGLGYALSWPLVKWIGSADILDEHKMKYEDARTAAWLRNLDKVTDPVVYVDNGWSMNDYNQFEAGTETIAFHWLKSDDEYSSIIDKAKTTWVDAGREWRWDNGVDASVSIQRGKRDKNGKWNEDL